MTLVYDPLVFDFGTFDASYGIPALLKVQVYPEIKKIMSSQVVVITAYIVDMNNPSRRYLFNPAGGVFITVTGPSGLVVIHNAAMRNVSIGIYQHTHQTGIMFDTVVFDPVVFDTVVADMLGVYTAYFTATDGGNFMRTIPQEVYEIVGG